MENRPESSGTELQEPKNQEPKKARKRLKLGKFLVPLPIAALVAAVAAAAIFGAVWRTGAAGRPERRAEVVTVSTLERIVNVSELSTFTAVYNGIAQVPSEQEPEKTDYYVSYEAKVNAGIDFEKIAFTVDADEKIIRASLPTVHITKVNVDITSMDYIFINDQRNTSSVSQEAYKACEADAQKESREEEAIFDLAKQNAENIMRALITPFVEQLDAAYHLEIEWEG